MSARSYRSLINHINSCIDSLKDEDGRTQTAELAIAVRKLREARMWIYEHRDVHGHRPPPSAPDINTR